MKMNMGSSRHDNLEQLGKQNSDVDYTRSHNFPFKGQSKQKYDFITHG